MVYHFSWQNLSLCCIGISLLQDWDTNSWRKAKGCRCAAWTTRICIPEALKPFVRLVVLYMYSYPSSPYRKVRGGGSYDVTCIGLHIQHFSLTLNSFFKVLTALLNTVNSLSLPINTYLSYWVLFHTLLHPETTAIEQ